MLALPLGLHFVKPVELNDFHAACGLKFNDVLYRADGLIHVRVQEPQAAAEQYAQKQQKEDAHCPHGGKRGCTQRTADLHRFIFLAGEHRVLRQTKAVRGCLPHLARAAASAAAQ